MPDQPGVYIEEVRLFSRIAGVETGTAGFVGVTQHVTGEGFDNDSLLDKPTLVTSWNEFTRNFGFYNQSRAVYLAPAVHGFFLNGGRRCYIVRVKDPAADADYIGSDNGPGQRTGLQALADVEQVKIVCVPGITSGIVQRAMIAHCESMRYRMCILDTDKDANVDQVLAQRAQVGSSRGMAALYYPWLKAAAETGVNGSAVDEVVPPSGHVAGVYARFDVQRGVYKAPANEIVTGALDLRVDLTDRQQGGLNPEGVNCIRKFAGRGIRIWGARTTADDPEFKYVNVRRLFNYLEESIEKGTRWAVFEPNDQKLWQRFSRAASDFLFCMWREGALMGAKPEEAYFVRCDRTTMTQSDIDSHRLVCLIGVAPVKPAEFVIFRIGQQTLSG